MMLHWLQQTGGKPLALMGGGTTMVGDPSGKDEIAQAADRRADRGQQGRHPQGLRPLHRASATGTTDAAMPDNAEWLATLNYIEFLRDVGRHFSVNRMLAMDSVKLRLEREHELSFLEFNYMCLQAYDFVELNRRYGCALQMGGSDQWGNIVTGLDLGRRMGTDAALRADLAAASPPRRAPRWARPPPAPSGSTPAMLSPYDYWQFWRNTEDADVGRFLKLFTLLPLDEIARLEALGGAEINEAKKILANEATALLHGREAAEAAAATARQDLRGRRARRSRCRPSTSPAAEFDAGPRRALRLRARRPRRLDRRSAAPDPRRRRCRVNDVALDDEQRGDRPRRAAGVGRRQAVARPQETRAAARASEAAASAAATPTPRLWPSAPLRGAAAAGVVPSTRAEDLAQESRRHRRQRIDVQRRSAGRADDAVIDAEQALVAARRRATGQRPEYG